MGLIQRLWSAVGGQRRAIALASSSPDDSPPAEGPLTKRSFGFNGSDISWANRQAEQYFGPYNPRYVPDWVFKIMGTDWSLGFAREIWLSAYHAVEYHVEGGDPRIRAFVEQIVERHLWQWVEASMHSLEYGRQACELVWSVEDVAFTFVEKRAAPKKPKAPPPGDDPAAPDAEDDEPEDLETEETLPGAYVLGELRDLDPEQTEILVEERTGDYRGLRYGGVELPGSKTLLVVNDSEFGNLRGRSMHLRSYNPWWWGNLVYLGLNRYLEKKGDPPLIAFAPGEEVADQDGNMHDPVRLTAVGLANLKSSGTYVFPQEFDPESKQPLYSVRALEIAARAPEFLETVDRYEQAKRLGWLIPGTLGAGQGGSFAADKVSQQLVHRLFDRRKQRLVLDPINKHVIPKLVRYNFGDVPASDMPRLGAGSMSENARELFAEILRSAATLETILPDGRRVKVAETIDMYKGLKTCGIPRVAYALIPDPAPPPALPAPGGNGFPTAGRPPGIVPEKDRPNAAGRPGQTAMARHGAAPDGAAAWFDALDSRLKDIDWEVTRAEKVSGAASEAVAARIRAALVHAVSGAETSANAAGTEVLDRDATLAADVERRVAAILDQAIHEELIDTDEVADKAALQKVAALARSPLADAHLGAFESAAAVLRSLGLPVPTPASAKRIVAGVAEDAKRNGRGIVERESRAAAELVGRIVHSGTPAAEAERAVAAHEVRSGDFARATVDHVRATARATIAWGGEQAGASRWLVALGPDEEKRLAERAPTGQVANLAWKTYTTEELDALYTRQNADRAKWSSWRDLGLTFGSPEMYVPLPLDAALLASVLAAAAARRKGFEAARTGRQAEIDGLNVEEPDAAAVEATGMARMDRLEGLIEGLALAMRAGPAHVSGPAAPPAPIYQNITGDVIMPANATASLSAQLGALPPPVIENHVHIDSGAVQSHNTFAPTNVLEQTVLPAPPTPIVVEAKAGEMRIDSKVEVTAKVEIPPRPGFTAIVEDLPGGKTKIRMGG